MNVNVAVKHFQNFNLNIENPRTFRLVGTGLQNGSVS